MLAICRYEMAVDGNLFGWESSVLLYRGSWAGFVIDHNPEIAPGAQLFRSGAITTPGSVPRGDQQICAEAWPNLRSRTYHARDIHHS
jgi:hypothetical protein